MRALILALSVLLCGLAAAAEDDGLAEAQDIETAKADIPAACSEPSSARCGLAQGRYDLLIADAVAEAGESRDRGLFIDDVRRLLKARSPDIRAAAIYALAKLAPDESDTPTIRALVFDPYSLVRVGAWAAAKASSDPAANLIAARADQGKRLVGGSTRPDPPFYDDATLALKLPAGARYLAIDQVRRRKGELVFVATETPEAAIAHFAAETGRQAVPLSEAASEPAVAAALARYTDGALFLDPQVVALEDPPKRLIVVYGDAGLQMTGFAVVWPSGQDLTPKLSANEPTPAEPDPAQFESAAIEDSGLNAEAGIADSLAWAATRDQGHFGARQYLENFPEGAYRPEAQTLLDAPGIETDALVYAEGAPITIRFFNLPPDLDGEVHLLAPGVDINLGYLHRRGGTDHQITPRPYDPPGIYRVLVYATPHGGGDTVKLTSEIRIAAKLAALSLSQDRVQPGAMMEVAFKGMSGLPGDRIAISDAGSADSASRGGGARLKGETEGTVEIQAPGRPGDYELRAFYASGANVVRARVPFTVAADAPPPPEEVFPDATVTPSKSRFGTDESITVHIAGLTGKQDWVAISRAEWPDRQYSEYQYTKGVKEGDFTFKPQKPGQYEIRVYFDYPKGGYTVRGRAPLTVE